MNHLTTQELETIRKRAEQATEGPWRIEKDSYVCNAGYHTTDTIISPDITSEVYEEYDADFIANARTDIPKLLAEVDRLRAVLTQIDELSDDFYNIESIDEVPTFVLRPDLEDYRDTIHEITALPYEAINGGD